MARLTSHAENEAGSKDTAVVYPSELLKLSCDLTATLGRYFYDCHMLEHEDKDMMRPYEVVADKSWSACKF